MQTANLVTKAHEFAHTFNEALRVSHNNAMRNVSFTYTPLGGSPSTGAQPSIGVPTGGTQVEFYTSSEANNIGNPAFWGDETVSFEVLNASGVKIGDLSVNIADLDIDQHPNDPNSGVNDNVSDRIAEAVNSGDPGYAPKINSVLAANEAPQPTFIVDNGKYKLTDGAEDDALGFDFDAFGNKFPAKIRYYPYASTNDVNDAHLDLPAAYGSKENGVTRAEAEAGIDKSFYDTNYPGVDIVWKRYSFDPDSLGESSEIITLGIESSEITDFKVFPNPASDVINIQSQESFEHIEIYNALGQSVLKLNKKTNSNIATPFMQIPIHNLKPGIYLMKARTDNGKHGMVKIIIE